MHSDLVYDGLCHERVLEDVLTKVLVEVDAVRRLSSTRMHAFSNQSNEMHARVWY